MASGLLQKIIPNHRIQHHIFRGVLYVSLVLCLWMFIRLFNDQRVRNDASASREMLKESKFILNLSNIRTSFWHCENPEKVRPESLELCATDPAQNTTMDVFLANSTRIPELKNSLGKVSRANWVKMIIDIGETELEWLSNKSQVVLILPRNVHRATYVLTTDGYTKQFGFAADTTFSLTREDLLSSKKIEIRMRLFDGLVFFGPADVPAVLSRPEKVRDYSGLIWMQKEAANLSRQFQLGIPVVLAAIAIVLDHSIVMSYLALYGASRAIHDFLGFKIDGGIQLSPVENILYLMSCGFGFAFLVLFTATIVGLNVRRIKLAHRWLFVCIMGGLFGLGGKLDPSFSTTSDLWGDSLSIAASFCVIFYAGYERFRHPPTAETKASNPESYSRLSVALVVTRLALVCAAFSIHGWVNVRDLVGILTKDASLKSPLDWKIMILMPSLMTAALLEVGSTAKKMLTFGRDMAEKALIEQELNVGREVQARMLPKLKTTTDSWVWRATYLPAEALAGDWFDIRELKFSDGRTLLAACVADVTGHGVGSSLATSVICSHWGLWCEKLRNGEFPETPELKQEELRRAPHSIHMGLKALPQNENCTAIFALFDPIREEITFCSAGHPGIFCLGSKLFRYFTTQGERLGSDVLVESTWSAKTEKLTGDELIVLYSDGLVPLRATVSSWAAQIKRKVASGNIEIPEKLLVEQLRINKNGFRTAHDLVDDMTLVMVRRSKKSEAKTPGLPENSESDSGQMPEIAQTA
ncbi:MAG: PP2C family protein-serine/threonine phosphatase [Silvanigrellaceae bacterium]